MIRDDPPRDTSERPTLEDWLTYQRQTLAMKCEDLTPQQLCERTVPPSSMSLIGLVRHMADVERHWFQRFISGADKAAEPPIFYSQENLDGDFDDVDPGTVDDDAATWRAECVRSDEVFAGCDLDDSRPSDRGGGDISIRWVLIHMIEEYARHNGHADFLRERIDGSTGD